MIIRETTLSKPIIEERDGTKLPETVLCRVSYNICNIGERNANKRVYEREVWDNVLANDTLKEMMGNRRLFGQAEHPAETQSDLQLTSHVIHNMWIDEDTNNVWQTMDVLDTPMGRIVDSLIRGGCGVGVSTRAEGDLEESEDDEGAFSRVVPESYRYITTDFTADPSTYDVLPQDVKRNVVSAVQTEMVNESATKEERDFARALMENLRCKKEEVRICKGGGCGCCKALEEKKEANMLNLIKEGQEVHYKDREYTVEKVDEAAQSITLRPDIENRGIEIEQDAVVITGSPIISVGEDGTITITPVPMEMDPEPIPGEELPLEAEPEPSLEELEPEMGEACGDKHKDKKKVKEGLEIYVEEDLELAGFNKGREYQWNQGRLEILTDDENRVNLMLKVLDKKYDVRREGDEIKFKPVKEGMDQWVARKEELLAKKESGDWNEEYCQELAAIEKKLKDTGADIDEMTLPTEGGVSARVMKGNVLKDPEGKTFVVSTAGPEGLGLNPTGGGVGAGSPIPWDQVQEKGFVKIGEGRRGISEQKYHFDSTMSGIAYDVEFLEDGTFYIDEDGVRIAEGDWSGAGAMGAKIHDPVSVINLISDLMEEHEVPSSYESTDLRIKEAVTRAEKEKALERIEELAEKIGSLTHESSDARMKFKMIMGKMKEATAVYDEVNALRVKLEERAKIAHDSTESLKEAKAKLEEAKKEVDEQTKKGKLAVQKLAESHTKNVKAIKESNQDSIKTVKEKYDEKLTEAKNQGLNEGTKKVLSDYVDRRLAELDLSIGENTRALLDNCESIKDVEDVLEKTKDMQRRNALHSDPIEEIRIRNQHKDPEQAKVDREVGLAFEGM